MGASDISTRVQSLDADVAAANAKEVLGVPPGELTVSKLFVHPIKVSPQWTAALIEGDSPTNFVYPGIVRRAVGGHRFRKRGSHLRALRYAFFLVAPASRPNLFKTVFPE